MPSSTSALKLLDLIQSHRVTAVIYVAAKLRIAELLCNGPKSLNELAKATGADQHALGRLLTALSTVGICSRVGDDRYALTEIAPRWMKLQTILLRVGQSSKAKCSPNRGTGCLNLS